MEGVPPAAALPPVGLAPPVAELPPVAGAPPTAGAPPPEFVAELPPDVELEPPTETLPPEPGGEVWFSLPLQANVRPTLDETRRTTQRLDLPRVRPEPEPLPLERVIAKSSDGLARFRHEIKRAPQMSTGSWTSDASERASKARHLQPAQPDGRVPQKTKGRCCVECSGSVITERLQNR